MLLLTFGLVLALLAMGYGALFSMLDDIRDEYGIGESALGAVIGMGFLAGFVSQIVIAPFADRGYARLLVYGGVALNVVGLLLLAAATAFLPLLFGRFVMGIGIGMAVPAIKRIVIVAEPDRIGHNVGRLLAADVAGFAFRPGPVGTAGRPVRDPGAVPGHRRGDAGGDAVRRAQRPASPSRPNRPNSASPSTCCGSARSPGPSCWAGRCS